jgi:hypothetical protein
MSSEPATTSVQDMRAAAFTRNDVLDMYRTITRIIRSSTHDSGVSVATTILGAALDNEPRDVDTTPTLLRHVFPSLLRQADFVVRNAATRRYEDLAALTDDVLETETLRPVIVTNHSFVIDMSVSRYVNYTYDDCSSMAVRYRSSALAFIEKGIQNMSAEIRRAKEEYDNIERGLVQYPGHPMFYLHAHYSTGTYCRSCVITGVDRGAICLIPDQSQIVVLCPKTNTRLLLDVKYTNRRGTIHCSAQSGAALSAVESFDGKPVVILQKEFEDTTSLRRQAFDSLVWRRGIHTVRLARCLVGEAVTDETHRHRRSGILRIRSMGDAVWRRCGSLRRTRTA